MASRQKNDDIASTMPLSRHTIIVTGKQDDTQRVEKIIEDALNANERSHTAAKAKHAHKTRHFCQALLESGENNVAQKQGGETPELTCYEHLDGPKETTTEMHRDDERELVVVETDVCNMPTQAGTTGTCERKLTAARKAAEPSHLDLSGQTPGKQHVAAAGLQAHDNARGVRPSKGTHQQADRSLRVEIDVQVCRQGPVVNAQKAVSQADNSNTTIISPELLAP
jgi:hypothetical protein